MKYLADLDIFARIVRTGNMSATAREIGMSPAAVSKALKRLEEALDVRLLNRTTRQVVVTEAGQIFYERITDVLAALDEVETFMAGKGAEIAGSLRISAPTSFGRLHVAPHLCQFMSRHPKVRIELVLSDRFSDIIAEGYDLAIRISALKDTGLVARRLASVRRVLCASPEYVAAHGKPATFDELKTHQCLPSHNGEPWRLEGPQGLLIYRPQGLLTTNSSEVIREAVISGLGIALRSTWDIGKELAEGKLVQLLPEYEGAKDVAISALYPSRHFLLPKVRAFIDYLHEIYRKEPYWEGG